MKKKIKVLFIVIAVIIILVSVLYYINYLQYDLKLISKFTVPELPKHSNHSSLDIYPVSFAVSDSVIYIVDATDSISTKSYSYSFNGDKLSNFKLPERTGYCTPINPERTGYWGIFGVDYFHYLPYSKRLAYIDYGEWDIDFFTLEGDYIGSQQLETDKVGSFVDMAEHGDKLYYISSLGERGRSKVESYLYIEGNDRILQEIKTVKPFTVKNVFCPPWKMLQIDSYNADRMAISEVLEKGYLVTLYNQDKIDTLRIARDKYRLPWQWADFPSQFILGKNFVVFGSWQKHFALPLITRIYDLKGHYKGRLRFRDNPKNELIDIIGNRLVAFNPATGTVSIYKIKVR